MHLPDWNIWQSIPLVIVQVVRVTVLLAFGNGPHVHVQHHIVNARCNYNFISADSGTMGKFRRGDVLVLEYVPSFGI